LSIVSRMNAFSVNQGAYISPNISQLEKDYIQTLDDIEYGYNPFSLTKIQSYIPIYSYVLDLSLDSCDHIGLNNPLEFCTLESVINKLDPSFPKLERSVFIKFSPLLDPIKYMTGKYDLSKIVLPSSQDKSLPKIEDVNNASYVDGFFCYLSSQLMDRYRIPHCIQYYGSHLAFQRKFKMIMDDLDYLSGSSYFLDNMNKMFFISKCNFTEEDSHAISRGNKPKLRISQHSQKDIDLDLDLEVVDVNSDLAVNEISNESSLPTASSEPLNLIYEFSTNGNTNETVANSEDSSDNNSLLNYSSDESDEDDNEDPDDDDGNSDKEEDEDEQDEYEDEDEDGQEDEDEDEDGSDDDDDDDDEEEEEDDDSDEEEPEIYAYINDFPVQMICLEKCSGTFDELFTKGKIDENNGASALFQIVMTLIIYQKAFHFTHNDLHTNNIMYVETSEPYLYYKYEGVYYRVPTYGYVYKIIDFGRSIYKWNGKKLCSDSFALGGDAATQYNCEPFFDENKPRLEPNYSFDLCRLGVSIYDFVIDEDESPEEMDDFQKIIYEWCLDDNGKNILYKKNGMERYPNFKLYKMIARTVHDHSPQGQLDKPLFKDFKISNNKWNKISSSGNVEIIDIDNIPFLG